MSLQTFLLRYFGFQISSQDRTVAVGVLSTVVCQNNPNRTQVSIFNLSGNNVVIGFTPAVTAANGILLAPNGGFVSLQAPDDGELPGRQIWGIAAAASNVYVVEVVGYR